MKLGADAIRARGTDVRSTRTTAMAPTRATTRHLLAAVDEVLVRRDNAAADLIAALAVLLVPSGLTPKRLSDLAKRAFVEVAASAARLRNGKINHSKAAVLTGLARFEVKRLLRTVERHERATLAAPVDRVMIGWLTDSLFTSPSGYPRRLAVEGATRSFAELVRRYGGDVTHRSVLDELRRLDVVHVSSSGRFVTLTLGPKSEWRRVSTRLSAVVPTLANAAKTAANATRTGRGLSTSGLRLFARDALELSMIRERVNPAVQTLVTGLAESLGRSNSDAALDAAYELSVNVFVSDGPLRQLESARSSVKGVKRGRTGNRKKASR